MKIEEIRSKTDAELAFELTNMRKELFELRFKSTTSGIQSPAMIRTLRRSLARVNTIIHERQSGIRGQEAKA